MDSSQTTSKLAAAFSINDEIILIQFHQIRNLKKQRKWVPNELNEQHQLNRVKACVNLLNRHSIKGILNRIVT